MAQSPDGANWRYSRVALDVNPKDREKVSTLMLIA